MIRPEKMTYNKDIDQKQWKAEREAMKEAIKHWMEIANHEIKQHAKYQKLYFEMKQKYETCEAITKEAIAKKVAEYVEANNRAESYR